jgi:hypothetical protein
MVKKSFGAAATVALLLCAVFALEYGRAQEGSPLRGLRVKVHYKGSVTVDERHKILVFLFDSPEFGHSNIDAVRGAEYELQRRNGGV